MSVMWVLLPWFVVVLVLWASVHIAIQVMRQNGLILLRLEAMEELLSQRGSAPVMSAPEVAGSEGLLPETEAPDFELLDLDGQTRSLSDWRGRRVLLVFFDLGCGFCRQLLPDLAELPIDGAEGRPLPLLVANGSATANRSLREEHGLSCPVLLLDGSDVAAAFEARGTPVGYLIDEHGRIESPLAIGGPALLALAHVTRKDREARGEMQGSLLRPLSESRIARDGLPVGTVAPSFTLPRLEGGELSLEEYRGRRLLLLFSDPQCGPCDHLAARLEVACQETRELEVVMISRGDLDANRRKVAQHGLSFPVVLQRSWEISRLYARFGTPIAYLIEESGLIAADVAVGPDSILSLLSQASALVSKSAEAKPTHPGPERFAVEVRV